MRLPRISLNKSSLYFNPRTHVGCDHCQLQWRRDHSHFNPRTHVGCDQAIKDCCCQTQQFQSTHPRGVRRTNDLGVSALTIISIHAPTWGATGQYSKRDFHSRISIHAPTWGATAGRHRQGERRRDFNPRTHVGCDTACVARFFSLHRFQSTHPRGVRLFRDFQDARTTIFQSTHPRGVRPEPPRYRRRGMVISIHAPTWGATSRARNPVFRPTFQSTHPRGVRLSRRVLELPDKAISIHAPTWGATWWVTI